MRKKFPAILEDEQYGVEATKLYKDALELLDQIISNEWLVAKAVFGLFPANSNGKDDLTIYQDDSRETVLKNLHHLRQQGAKAAGIPNICLADYVAPKDTGVKDYIGGFCVTAGLNIEKQLALFDQAQDDYNAILLKALADRLAEAFAEYLHERIRKDYWGYDTTESLDNEALIKEKYRGIRPAPGYPACPDHTEKASLFELLDVEHQIGVSLTESYAMYPAASVSGWYFAHPSSKYFGLGLIDKSQVKDYAQRKGISLSEAEKWLRPSISYL